MGAKRSVGQFDYDALWRRAQYEAKREVELMYPLGDPRAREKRREIALKHYNQMAAKRRDYLRNQNYLFIRAKKVGR